MNSLRRAAGFGAGLAAVAAVTLAIVLLRGWLGAAALALLYLLAVLWVGSRWGSPAALWTALLSFLAYDFFFVPPYFTLAVSAPAQVAELVIFLAGALFGGQLAARLREQRAAAEAAARASRTLYEIAVEALRAADADAALRLVSEAAVRLGQVSRFSVLAPGRDGLDRLAGDAVAGEDLKRATWAHSNQQPLGLRLAAGRLALLEEVSGQGGAACLPVPGGVVVIAFAERPPAGEELRLLASLAALAALLLDRRRAARESDLRAELEASDRLKAAVLSSLSHELRSPLASLRLGLSSLAMREAGLDAEQRELLAGLDAQAARLDRLVGDLLTLSRLEAGADLELTPSSYPELVGAVLRRLAAELAPFKVEVELDPELPDVMVDELQLDRVLTNLLQNAIEWTPPGAGISLGARASEGRLVAWVENDGPEIAPADLQSVFDKFWTGRAQGTGLGLAICRRVIEAHGGTIQARNLRRGPRFEFTLPLAAVRAGA